MGTSQWLATRLNSVSTRLLSLGVEGFKVPTSNHVVGLSGEQPLSEATGGPSKRLLISITKTLLSLGKFQGFSLSGTWDKGQTNYLYPVCVWRIYSKGRHRVCADYMATRLEEKGDRYQVTLCISFLSLLNLKGVQVHLSFCIPTVLSPQKKFQESSLISPFCAPPNTCFC